MSGPPSEAPPPADRRDAGEDVDDEVDEEVDEASEESFPASDAPQSWAGPPDRR